MPLKPNQKSPIIFAHIGHPEIGKSILFAQTENKAKLINVNPSRLDLNILEQAPFKPRIKTNMFIKTTLLSHTKVPLLPNQTAPQYTEIYRGPFPIAALFENKANLKRIMEYKKYVDFQIRRDRALFQRGHFKSMNNISYANT